MTSLGIHHVDTFRYLLGPIVRVMAMSGRRAVSDAVEIDDTTSILLEFASGVLGYLGTSFSHANRTAVIALHGADAQAESLDDGSRLTLRRRGEAAPQPIALTPADAIAEELVEFGRSVREGTAPEVGGEEATANVAVLEAIVEAAETDRPVEVRA